MHEQTRLAYLRALGVDAYVSRWQLPGAAMTPRAAAPSTVTPAPAAPIASLAARRDPRDNCPTPDGDERAERAEPAREAPAEVQAPAEVPRFTFVTLAVGECLWLENIGESPLRSEQAALVRAMAYALARARGSAPADPAALEVARFDWPMHDNRQLDNGPAAARASLAAFVERRLREGGGGLVLLGDACEIWLAPADLDVPVVRTASTAQVLSQPQLKAQVWRDLEPLRRG